MTKTNTSPNVSATSPAVNGREMEPVLHSPSPTAPTSDSTPAQGPSMGPAPDLDLARFRINQNFASLIQTRKTAVMVSVRRPDRQAWVYIHPERAWRVQVAVLEDRINQRTFIVIPELVPELTGDLVPKLLVTYATLQGAIGLWPIRMPDESGRLDTYNECALSIIEQYSGQWVRILPNQAERGYDVLQSPATQAAPPQWPEGGFPQLFSLAFKNRVINHVDHPALKALRGESA